VLIIASRYAVKLPYENILYCHVWTIFYQTSAVNNGQLRRLRVFHDAKEHVLPPVLKTKCLNSFQMGGKNIPNENILYISFGAKAEINAAFGALSAVQVTCSALEAFIV
jgi:hypothetical protein